MPISISINRQKSRIQFFSFTFLLSSTTYGENRLNLHVLHDNSFNIDLRCFCPMSSYIQEVENVRVRTDQKTVTKRSKSVIMSWKTKSVNLLLGMLQKKIIVVKKLS